MDLSNLYDAESDDEDQNQRQQQPTQAQTKQEDLAEEDLLDEYPHFPSPPLGQQPTFNNEPLAPRAPPVAGPPTDQIHHRQVRGAGMPYMQNTHLSIALNELAGLPLLLPPNVNSPYAPPPQDQPPTEDEILDAEFGVQIGETRFSNLRAAIAGASSLVPSNPGFLAVHGRKAPAWNRSMVDRYPYYHDGPQNVDQESRQQWVDRIVKARNQMGIIRLQEPLGMDLIRAGETAPQSRKRCDAARHKAEKADAKHKRRIDPTNREYNAKYAFLWRASQDRIRAHNTNRRALGLQNRRAFDASYNRPPGPDPQVPEDGGDDLYDFSWHRRQLQTIESRAAAAQQHQQGIAQTTAQESHTAAPKATRCTQCKKQKKRCDLGETSFPCTRCREKNHKCEGCDTPRAPQKQPEKKARMANEPRERRPAQRLGQGASTPASPPAPEWLFDHGYISGPAPEFQGVASRLSRREDGPPRPRSASP
jgi:hypothetical protein